MTRQERAMVALRDVVEMLLMEWVAMNRPSTMAVRFTDLVVLEELCGVIDDVKEQE
jgi:hypothetical protein